MYPLGMQMPYRNYSSDKYRYGFNGKEKDKDLNILTAYDYGFRIYNPSIGKFLNVDPLTQKYPWYTPYQFAGNKPIKFIDLDGAEEQKHWYDYSAMDLMNWLGEPDNPFKDNGFMHKFATSTNRGINPFYNGAALVFGENNLGPSSDYTPMRRHEAAFNLITQWMFWKYLKIAESNQTPANLEGSLGKPSPKVETKPQQQTTQLKPTNDDIQKVKEWVKANPSKAEVKPSAPKPRPTPAQSEAELTPKGPNELNQPIFKNGNLQTQKIKSSVIPESYNIITSVATEVKNFTFKPTGASPSSINTLVTQILQRQSNLPKGTFQNIIVDIRGQNVGLLQQWGFRNAVLERVRTPNVNITFQTQ